jgi:hypothetical protein
MTDSNDGILQNAATTIGHALGSAAGTFDVLKSQGEALVEKAAEKFETGKAAIADVAGVVETKAAAAVVAAKAATSTVKAAAKKARSSRPVTMARSKAP